MISVVIIFGSQRISQSKWEVYERINLLVLKGRGGLLGINDKSGGMQGKI